MRAATVQRIAVFAMLCAFSLTCFAAPGSYSGNVEMESGGKLPAWIWAPGVLAGITVFGYCMLQSDSLFGAAMAAVIAASMLMLLLAFGYLIVGTLLR